MPSISLNNYLPHGLRREDRIETNAAFWQTLQGLRSLENALRSFEVVTQPFTDNYLTSTLGRTKAHPWPQLFIGKTAAYLCFETSIYQVTQAATASGWTATLITPYEIRSYSYATDTGVTTTIPAGGAWQFVDNYGQVMFFNGACHVFNTGFTTKWFCNRDEPESTVNGTFTGSATPWTLNSTGANWSYSANTIVHTAGSAGTTILAAADQASGYGTLAGFQYRVTVVVTAISGTLYVSIGGGTEATITATGTSTLHIISGVNPQNILLRQISADSVTVDSVSVIREGVRINTGCIHKEGRVVYGGFDSRNIYNLVNWPNFYAGFDDNTPTWNRLIENTYAGMGSNWVWWGSIHGGDTFWLYWLDLMKYGSLETSATTGYSNSYYYFSDLWAKNQSGARPMPWAGDIMAVKPLGDNLMVYGGYSATSVAEGSVAALTAIAGPVATYGLLELPEYGYGPGIKYRTAVGGDRFDHVWIADTGEIWAIDGSMRAQRLGYKHLGLGSATAPLVSYDPQMREFYIATGDGASWLLNRNGMCKHPENITGVGYAGSGAGLVGIKTSQSYAAAISLATVPFDATIAGGQRGEVFNIQMVRISTTDIDSTGWQVSCGYRMSEGRAFTTSTPIGLSAEGEALVDVPGVDAYLILTHPDKADTNGIDGIYLDIDIGGRLATRKWVGAAPGAATIVP